jgi:regulator of protease activity HflC (stomatin/prohibitin superfamily)
MVDTGGTATPRRVNWFVRRVLMPAENWLVRNSTRFTVTAVLLLLLFALLSPLMLYNISPGQVGVIWRRFGGTDVDHYLMEGLQIVYPWNRVYKYETRLQREEREFDVLSEDGLSIVVRIAWRYSLNAKYVGLLHQYIGPTYNDVLIAPDIAERARDVFAANKPEEIWTNRRTAIQQDILTAVRRNISASFKPPGFRTADFINLEDILVTGLTLPLAVQQSIVRKNVENQRQQEMDYRLLYERKESERKAIEAAGVRQFQDVVSYGLTNSYLQWRGIEATLELSKSNNAKVVVIGNSANGLPLILGGFDKEGAPIPGDFRLRPSADRSVMPAGAMPPTGTVEPQSQPGGVIGWWRRVWAAARGESPPDRPAASGTPASGGGNTAGPPNFGISPTQTPSPMQPSMRPTEPPGPLVRPAQQ